MTEHMRVQAPEPLSLTFATSSTNLRLVRCRDFGGKDRRKWSRLFLFAGLVEDVWE